MRFSIPEDRPQSHPGRAQLSHAPRGSDSFGKEPGTEGPRFQFVWKGKTGSSQQQMGGKCSKDPKCCATHVHTSKSLNPHRVLVTNLPPAGLYTEDFARRRKVVRCSEPTISSGGSPTNLTTSGISDWPATSTTTAIASTEARVTSTQICPVYV